MVALCHRSGLGGFDCLEAATILGGQSLLGEALDGVGDARAVRVVAPGGGVVGLGVVVAGVAAASQVVVRGRRRNVATQPGGRLVHIVTGRSSLRRLQYGSSRLAVILVLVQSLEELRRAALQILHEDALAVLRRGGDVVLMVTGAVSRETGSARLSLMLLLMMMMMSSILRIAQLALTSAQAGDQPGTLEAKKCGLLGSRRSGSGQMRIRLVHTCLFGESLDVEALTAREVPVGAGRFRRGHSAVLSGVHCVDDGHVDGAAGAIALLQSRRLLVPVVVVVAIVVAVSGQRLRGSRWRWFALKSRRRLAESSERTLRPFFLVLGPDRRFPAGSPRRSHPVVLVLASVDASSERILSQVVPLHRSFHRAAAVLLLLLLMMVLMIRRTSCSSAVRRRNISVDLVTRLVRRWTRTAFRSLASFPLSTR